MQFLLPKHLHIAYVHILKMPFTIIVVFFPERQFVSIYASKKKSVKFYLLTSKFISVDGRKVFEKIESLHKKVLKLIGLERRYLNIIKIIYDKPIFNNILN